MKNSRKDATGAEKKSTILKVLEIFARKAVSTLPDELSLKRASLELKFKRGHLLRQKNQRRKNFKKGINFQQKQSFKKFRERKRPRKITQRQAQAARTFTKLPLPNSRLSASALKKPDKPICEDQPVYQKAKVPTGHLPTLISGVRIIPVPIPYPVFIPIPFSKSNENNEEKSDFEKEVLNALHLSLKSGN